MRLFRRLRISRFAITCRWSGTCSFITLTYSIRFRDFDPNSRPRITYAPLARTHFILCISVQPRSLEKRIVRSIYRCVPVMSGAAAFKVINSFVSNRAENIPGNVSTVFNVDERRPDSRYTEIKQIDERGNRLL